MEGYGNSRDRFGRFGRYLCMVGRASIIAILCFAPVTPYGDPIRDGQIRGIFVVASCAIFEALRRSVGAPLSALLSYGVLMWSLKGFEPNGYVHFSCITVALLAAFWLSRMKRVDAYLSYAGMLQAVFGIAQWFGWNPWMYNFSDIPWARYKPTGFFGQETILGAFLVACLAPALFSRRWWAAVPIAFCAWATHSTMTLGASIAVIALWAWRDIGKIPVIAVSAIFGAFLVVAYDPNNPWFSDTERLRFWKIGWDAFMEKPIFGRGPGSWLPNSPILELRLTHLHNEYLEFLTEYGSVGGIFAAWCGVDFLWKFRLTWHHALVVGLAVNAFGNFPFHIANLGTIFLTAWLLSVREHGSVVHLRS